MKTIKRITVVIVLARSLFISGCGPGQILGPTITPIPTRTPTPVPVEDGKWKTTDANEMNFEVKNNQIYSLGANIYFPQYCYNTLIYTGQSFYGPKYQPVDILNGTFSVNVAMPVVGKVMDLQMKQLVTMVVKGTFDSQTDAHGTIQINGGQCGNRYDIWNAKRSN